MNKYQQELEWTGERYVPQIRGTIALEHLHRYAYASEYVKGKVVLDIASGEGYGSEMLSRTAKHVYGVDIDAVSVAHAQKKYSSERLTFVEGSCTEIPLEDASVDIVVSFETIEHITNHDRMLQELKRVLLPGGILIISSPERHEYSEVPKHENPFHLKELDQEEFRGLLMKYFKHFALLGQRVVHGSALVEMDKPSEPLKTYQFDQLPQQITSKTGLPHPIYLVGVCSDNPMNIASGGLCEQNIYDSEAIREYQNTIATKDELILTKSREIIHLRLHIEYIKSTLSWKVTKPLRLIKNKIKVIIKPVKRLLLAI